MLLLKIKPYDFHSDAEHPLRNRSKILRVAVRMALEVWAVMLIALYPLALYLIYIVSHAYSYNADTVSAWLQRKPDLLSQYTLVWIVSMMCWWFVKSIPYGTEWVKSSRMLARRLTAVDATSALSHDARPPVLYLRSFLDRYVGNDILAQTESDENLMFPVLKEVGPVIAVGQPGESLPPLGAARHYLDENCQWQATVTDYISRAKLVMISPSYSDGVIWEAVKAFQLCRPEQVIISLISFVPELKYSKNPDDYKLFRDAIKTNTEFELPENIDESLFIHFDSRRNARIVKADIKRLNSWLAEVVVRDAMRELLLAKGIIVRSRMPSGWYISNIYRLILISIALFIPIMTAIRALLEWLR